MLRRIKLFFWVSTLFSSTTFYLLPTAMDRKRKKERKGKKKYSSIVRLNLFLRSFPSHPILSRIEDRPPVLYVAAIRDRSTYHIARFFLLRLIVIYPRFEITIDYKYRVSWHVTHAMNTVGWVLSRRMSSRSLIEGRTFSPFCEAWYPPIWNWKSRKARVRIWIRFRKEDV